MSEPSVTLTSPPPTVDLFASSEPVAPPEAKIPKPESMTTPNIVDPFAAVPMQNFDGSDPFGAFTSGPQAPVVTNTTTPVSLADSKPQQLQKKDPFQVKSGIWADSLSRGLIDLNITARKLKLPLYVLHDNSCLMQMKPRRHGQSTTFNFYKAQSFSSHKSFFQYNVAWTNNMVGCYFISPVFDLTNLIGLNSQKSFPC